MNTRLRNALTGRVEDLAPASPPLVRVRVWSSGDASTLAGFRLAHFYLTARSALSYLGWQVQEVEEPKAEVDVHFGLREPGGKALVWIKPDARALAPQADTAALQAAGYGPGALTLACLRARYDAPLELSQADLDAARSDALRLAGLENWLRSSRGAAPNVNALAGYRKRLRDALARDFDLPEALAVLWDALRPGALSPGSQLAFLKEASVELYLPQA